MITARLRLTNQIQLRAFVLCSGLGFFGFERSSKADGASGWRSVSSLLLEDVAQGIGVIIGTVYMADQVQAFVAAVRSSA